jgi:DNA ligase (NAD+)
MVMTQIQSLNARLEEARKSYYAGEPIMSDAEYDVLEQQLAGLNRTTPDGSEPPSVLTTVGTDAPGRIPHRHPMRSIKNLYSFEDVYAWAESLGWPVLTLSGKYDGISCSLTYENGDLVKAVTRGDGDAGESILDQVRASRHIPSKLPEPRTVEVRGELVILHSHMEALNVEILAKGGKPYVSTRNLVAGTMKMKDLEEVAKREVRCLPWEVLADGETDSARNRIFDLSPMFDVPPIYVCENREELMEMLPNSVQFFLNAENQNVALDGVVIKVDSCAKRSELGYGS